ncbi:MAG TPA: cation diffusion facilitator family transporter [Thermoanaerobaculia bacterium]|nr:cation diffusion facilitator family transporter [Thermoanaerobaculia bacterium]
MQAVAAAAISLAVGVLIFGLKWLAWRLTGSVALYSDALESVVNVVAAGAATVALAVARRPADANHAFGHTKAEYFSAVLEGVLVLVAAAAIVREGVSRLAAPLPLASLEAGVAVSLLATLANGGLAWGLWRMGKRRRSPALRADAIHIATDVVTTVGVLAGIGLAWATGWWLLDPLIALAVAVNVLVAGWRLVRESLGGLMDEGLPADEMARLREVIDRPRSGVLEAHDLRTRRAGPLAFVQLHLVVEGGMTVEAAHEVCDGIEGELREALPGAEVTIHVEPETEAQRPGFRLGAPADAGRESAPP